MYEHDIATICGEGLDDGIAQGQERGNHLHERLLDDNRLDDLRHSTKDQAYQEQPMREYKIL